MLKNVSSGSYTCCTISHHSHGSLSAQKNSHGNQWQILPNHPQWTSCLLRLQIPFGNTGRQSLTITAIMPLQKCMGGTSCNTSFLKLMKFGCLICNSASSQTSRHVTSQGISTKFFLSHKQHI